MERWRRRIVILSIVIASGAWFWASLSPLLTVEIVDFVHEQENIGGFSDFRDEREEYLYNLPLKDFIREYTEKRAIQVKGEKWRELFSATADTSDCTQVDKRWQRRVSPEQVHGSYPRPFLFFEPDEEPLKELNVNLDSDNENYFLVLLEGGEKEYLWLRVHLYSRDNFQFGSGFTVGVRPPTHYIFPFRHLTKWILIAGFLLYIFLPWKRHDEWTIYYSRWRNILGDFVGFLIFIPFFVLPIIIGGGSWQALGWGWILTLILWPFAGAGLVVLRQTGWYTAFTVRVYSDRLVFSSLGGDEEISLSDITAWGPAGLKPPRWLIILTWISAFTTSGAQSAGAMGRAALLQGTVYGGIALHLRNGVRRFLWTTDQVGGTTLNNLDKLTGLLEDQGIPVEETPVIIESIGMPVSDDDSHRDISRRLSKTLIAMLSLPLAVVLVGSAAYFVVPMVKKIIRVAAMELEPQEKIIRETLQESDPEVLWEKTYTLGARGEETRGEMIIRGDGESWVIGGFTILAQNNIDICLLEIEAKGEKKWHHISGSDEWDSPNKMARMPDGGYVVAGMQMPGLDSFGDTLITILRTDSSGNKSWIRQYGVENVDNSAWDLEVASEGTIRTVGKSGDDFNILTVKESGEQIGLKLLGRLLEGENRWISFVRFAGDDTLIAGGEERNPESGDKEPFLIHLTTGGKNLWQMSYPFPDTGPLTDGIRTSDGGFAVAGTTGEESRENQDLIIFKVDRSGSLLWKAESGSEKQDQGVTLIEAADGGLFVLGTQRNMEEISQGIYLVGADRAGNITLARSMHGPGYHYDPAALAETGQGTLIITGERSKKRGLSGDLFIMEVGIKPKN